MNNKENQSKLSKKKFDVKSSGINFNNALEYEVP